MRFPKKTSIATTGTGIPAPADPNEPLVDASEVARFLNLPSASSVRNLSRSRCADPIPVVSVGPKFKRYRISAVRDWLNRQQQRRVA